MELSENTLKVLKNYSNINNNVMIRKGNIIKTISEARNILSRATVNETFERDFGVYDLNEFIGVLGLVDVPRVKLEEDHASVSDSTGRSKVKYFYSSEESLTTPQKDITMPEPEIKFTLDQSTLAKLKQAASALGHEQLVITPNEGLLTLTIADLENKTSNTYSIDIDGDYETGSEFSLILSIPNLKLLPGNYEVGISSKLITEFKNTDIDISYWIALEKTSNFG
tara:strand:- start:2371 stop:3045 length:675 start_codon:yes stop_codon:yes gene_type:complete